MNKNKKTTLTILFLIVLLDLVGLTIVIPFLPLIFKISGILPKTFSPKSINLLTGLLLSTYPLFQFLGSPILGSLSDKFGRKKVLVGSLLGSLLGYLIFPLGLWTKNIFLLFLSRAIDGFTGSNISTVMAAITDISSQKEKTKNYALIGMAFGLGLIIGPAIGGVLSNPNLFGKYSLETPFFAAAIITLFNLVFVSFALSETNKNIQKKKERLIEIIWQNLIPLKKISLYKKLYKFFASLFLINFGWMLFTNFFQIYLFEKFNFSPDKISLLYTYVGFWIVISQGVIVRRLSKYPPFKILKFNLPLVSLSLLIIVLAPNPKVLFFILPFLAISNGFTQPSFSSLLTSHNPKKSGEILGLRQSLISLTQILAPITGGVLLNFNYTTPLIGAIIIILGGWGGLILNIL